MDYEKRLSILFAQEGTCRGKRLLPELVRSDNLLHDKQFSGQLAFIYLYTDLLVYHDKDQSVLPSNIWRKFIERDDTVIRSLILHTELSSAKVAVDRNLHILREESLSPSTASYLDETLVMAKEFILLLNYWHLNLSIQDPIRTKLTIIIQKEIQPHIRILYKQIRLYNQQHKNGSWENFCDFIQHISHQSTLWKLTPPLTDPSSLQAQVSFNHQALMEQVHHFFYVVFNTVHELKEIARQDYFDTLYTQKKPPHLALLMAFSRLLQHAEAHLNHLPARLLDHYYRHVLKFNNHVSTPDLAHVHFLMDPEQSYCFLPKYTKLLATNPFNGEKILFETDRDLMVNQAKVSQINILLNDEQFAHTPTCLSTINYVAEDLKKFPFQLFPPLHKIKKTPDYTRLAVMIGSPLLYLSEGDRTITVKWKITLASFQALVSRSNDQGSTSFFSLLEQLEDRFHAMMQVRITTKSGWFCIPQEEIEMQIIQEDCTIGMVLCLNSDVPPITKLEDEYQNISYHLPTPTICISLRPGVSLMGFEFLHDLVLEKIDILVHVAKYRGLVLQNHLGLIDNSQLIEPFGPLPKSDSSFYIGSGEVFSKNLTDLKIHIKWNDLPNLPGGFKRYYSAYPTQLSNEDFKVKVSYLNHHHWHPTASGDRQIIPLFQTMKSDGENTEQLDRNTLIDHIDIAALGITKHNEPVDVAIYVPNTKTGFLKLKLDAPEQAFGHAIYPNLMSSVLLKNIQQKSAHQSIALNEPYTPRINSISVDYQAKESIIFAFASSKEEVKYQNNFFHITPFGYEQIFPNKQVKPATLLPTVYDKVSFIAFGIENMDGGSLSLHIELGQHSLNPDKPVNPPSWFYLSNDVWYPIKKEAITVDETNELERSGIILFNFPKQVMTNNTVMANGLFWIKAEFPHEIEKLPNIVGVYTQAVSASRILNKNGVFSSPILPEYTISQLNEPITSIQAVIQPFKTSSGRQFENHKAFYRRVSERLRHKNRTISAWDYEHMVLEKFPQLYKVQCMNHTKASEKKLNCPGYVTLVAVGNVAHASLNEPPIVEKKLLAEIKSYIETISPPFVQFEVINPIYEDIKVSIEVKFHPGCEQGFYINQLQKDLRTFFSPWIQNPYQDIQLGRDLPTSQIIDFIHKRPYIEGIGNFSMLKYMGKVPQLKLEKVTDYNSRLFASYPWSIMISSKYHAISALDTFDPNLKFRYGGLEDMAIGEDFVIGPWEPDARKRTKQHIDQDIPIRTTENYYLITKKQINKDHGINQS